MIVIGFTETANHHVDRERAWWLENRDLQDLFAVELEKAVEILALLPGAGTPYTQTGVPDLRRLYLRKLGCHLYYTFDADDVIIRASVGRTPGARASVLIRLRDPVSSA